MIELELLSHWQPVGYWTGSNQSDGIALELKLQLNVHKEVASVSVVQILGMEFIKVSN